MLLSSYCLFYQLFWLKSSQKIIASEKKVKIFRQKLKSCKLDKYFYIAEKAHEQHNYTLTDARQGVNLNMIFRLQNSESKYRYNRNLHN